MSLSDPVADLLTRVRNLLRIHQLKRELDRHQEKLRSGDTGVEDAIDD